MTSRLPPLPAAAAFRSKILSSLVLPRLPAFAILKALLFEITSVL
jgi:hypothetical protein